MTYRSREEQANWNSSGKMALLSHLIHKGDEAFDTPDLPRMMQPLNWLHETDVHGATKITSNLRNSNQFVGTQAMIVRDEVRKQTFVIAIEHSGLYLYTVVDAIVVSRQTVHEGDIRRAHIALRKYDGMPVVAYAVRDGDGWCLGINGSVVPDMRADVDFPFLGFKQPPIGYPAPTPPELCIITYKCRTTGDAFVARLDPMGLTLTGEPSKLPFEELFGGVDIAIGTVRTLFRANKLVGDDIVTSLLWADHDGMYGEPADVDMSEVPHDRQVPGNAHLAVDNEHQFHVPIVTWAGDRAALIDYLPGDHLFVSAVEGKHSDNVALGPFPSMGATTGALRAGFGDGVVDGSGMIATMNAGGKLLVSNSQSGGYSYAESALLNQDMQRAYKFRSTECYSRGANPNVVSMDYAFVESNDEHAPVSGELWLETWDMPLPEPVVDHEWDGNSLKITILKSAWFFPGQTAFEINPALTEITEARQMGWREMVLTFADPSKVHGATVSFTTKNVFYNYHVAFVA